MTRRLLFLVAFLTCIGVVGCTDSLGTGQSCFASDECSTGVCAETVYGQYCFNTCSADTVICDREEACVPGGDVSDQPEPDDLWVCLPGAQDLANDIEIVEVLGICTYSLDCVRGAICVCLDTQNCDPEDESRTGPICVQVCEPDVTLCPLSQDCVVLDDGTAFCDPTTSEPI